MGDPVVAPARELGRCARPRRDGHVHAAAHLSPVRWHHGGRGARRVPRRRRPDRLHAAAGALAIASAGQLRAAVGEVAGRRVHRGHCHQAREPGGTPRSDPRSGDAGRLFGWRPGWFADQHRARLPRLGRPVRERRLAARAARPRQQVDLGERGADVPEDGAEAGRVPGRRGGSGRAGTARARARRDRAGPCRGLRHGLAGVRPARGGRGALPRPGIRHQRPAPWRRSLVRPWPHRRAHRAQAQDRADAGAPLDGRPADRGLDHRGEAERDRRRACGAPGASAHCLQSAGPSRPPLGHGHRSLAVHGLQRLHDRVHLREQHPGGRQGAGDPQPGDALAARRPLLRGRRDLESRRRAPAADVRALRVRALRVRLPRQRDGA